MQPAPHNLYPDDYLKRLCLAVRLSEGQITDERILAALREFQQTWVKPEEAAGFRYTADIVKAYALFYMTMNMPKLWFAMHHLWPGSVQGLLGKKQTVRVTELGCGPGTFLLAWRFLWSALGMDAPLELTGVDQSPEFLGICKRLGKQFAGEQDEWQTLKADWRSLRPDCDVLILGNTIVEQDTQSLADWLPETNASLVVMLEPGTSVVFQRLLPIRDAMLIKGWQVHFPCPSHGQCPMSNTTNWCHFHINRFTLPFIQKMSMKAGRIKHRHHFAGFVFSKQHVQARADNGVPVRILSNVRKASRSAIRWLCDGEQEVEAVLNRKARSDANRPFAEAETGAAATLDLTFPRKRFMHTGRLHRDDQVTIN